MNDARHRGPWASLRRIRLIASHTLGEALHLRLTLVLGLIGAVIIGGARGLQEFNFGRGELKFLADFGLGALGLFGMLLAALATAQLFFRDIDTRAVYCVVTRPVRRWEYVAGKLAGTAGLLAVFTVALGLLLAGLLVWRSAELVQPAPAVRLFLCACALQWLKSSLVAAMTMLVCSYAGSALFASSTGLLLALVAHLRTFAPGEGWVWLKVWPNFSLFDAEGLLAAGAMPSPAWLTGLLLYWAAYGLLFGGLASYAFAHREL